MTSWPLVKLVMWSRGSPDEATLEQTPHPGAGEAEPPHFNHCSWLVKRCRFSVRELNGWTKGPVDRSVCLVVAATAVRSPWCVTPSSGCRHYSGRCQRWVDWLTDAALMPSASVCIKGVVESYDAESDVVQDGGAHGHVITRVFTRFWVHRGTFSCERSC